MNPNDIDERTGLSQNQHEVNPIDNSNAYIDSIFFVLVGW